MCARREAVTERAVYPPRDEAIARGVAGTRWGGHLPRIAGPRVLKTPPALDAPVALFVWNRPDATREVFEQIRRARPRQLLLVADAPRVGNADDAARCDAVRAIVAEVDWPCEVAREVASAHLGCRNRMASGLDWVFRAVPEAIVLEDDCVASPTFFRFCGELLARYRDEPAVMTVAGSTVLAEPAAGDRSYYFSRYNPTWGWASWRRAWRHYDVSVARWREIDQRAFLRGVFPNLAFERAWRHVFDRAHRDDFDTWDHQWTFQVWARGGVAAIPTRNLVRNIGFGADATHTKVDTGFGRRKLEHLDFPLAHPDAIAVDLVRERAIWQTVLGGMRWPPLG